jgi:hypothetical protein
VLSRDVRAATGAFEVYDAHRPLFLSTNTAIPMGRRSLCIPQKRSRAPDRALVELAMRGFSIQQESIRFEPADPFLRKTE